METIPDRPTGDSNDDYSETPVNVVVADPMIESSVDQDENNCPQPSLVEEEIIPEHETAYPIESNQQENTIIDARARKREAVQVNPCETDWGRRIDSKEPRSNLTDADTVKGDEQRVDQGAFEDFEPLLLTTAGAQRSHKLPTPLTQVRVGHGPSNETAEMIGKPIQWRTPPSHRQVGENLCRNESNKKLSLVLGTNGWETKPCTRTTNAQWGYHPYSKADRHLHQYHAPKEPTESTS